MAKNGFNVDPEELHKFAKYVDGLITDLGETQDKLADTGPGPLSYGLFGEWFAIAVAKELKDAKSTLSDYEDSITSLHDTVKDTVNEYESGDSNNAKMFESQV